MNSPIVSMTIPYIDMRKALESLDLNDSHAIIAMGINNHFYSEIKGFNCDDNNHYYYKNSKVYQIKASDSSMIIMKASELPFFKLCDNK